VRRRHLCVSLILGIVAFAVFLRSPLRIVADSNYSMLLSYQLMKNHTFRLDEYFHKPLDPIAYPTLTSNGLPYQVEELNGHIYYLYPPGSSLLSLPVVALFSAFGYTPVNDDLTYNREHEQVIESFIAALLMAVSTVVMFYVALEFVPLHWALIIATGFALGTQVWSTASRVLWTHTWSVFLSSIIILILTKLKRFSIVEQLIIGTLLSWSFFVRPTNAIMIVAVTSFLLIVYKYKVLPTLITGGFWFICFILFSRILYASFLPIYYGASIPNYHGTTFLSQFAVRMDGIAGMLISPSRGVLIYVPVILFVCFLLLVFRKYIMNIPIFYVSIVIYIANILLYSSFSMWWAGHAYGARYLTDVVPWLVVCSAVGIDAMLRWKGLRRPSPFRYAAILSFGAILLSMSIFINGRGAICQETWAWNVTPENVDKSALQRWNWRYPQFLAGIIPAPRGK